MVDVRRLAAEARANPGIEVALSEGTANAFRDALAAPGAATAARGQEVDEATALKGGRWVSAADIEHMTGELLSLATGDPYTPTKMVDAFHTLRAALAWQAIHEDDLSATERFIVDGGVKQAAFFPVDANRLANIALHCIREVRATRAAAAAREPCATCGASEPFTGSCGTSDGDTRALCKRASRQEAPAASAEEWMPVTPEQHSKAFAAGDLMALAEEAGGARMAENVVQVTRSDIERIIYFAKNREDTAARSPATVAQPVDAGASRKSAKDAAEYEVREWMGENDVVLKSAAYRALITLVLAAQSAAQPCPSQGCGGDGGVEAASMYAQKHGLAVTVEWMRGWNACLDAVAASSTDKGDGGSKE
ncbi:hypothetical protein C4F17_12455 [Variovorax sp. PMC12]|nr:hypothetical protein C4F17_12455 [Variovorax sp. PMC12]